MIQVLYDASCAECLRAIQLVSYREETLRTFRVSLVFVLLGFLQGWPVKHQLFSSMPGRRERESCKACNPFLRCECERKPQCPCSQWQGLSSSKRPTSLSRKVGAWELDFWGCLQFPFNSGLQRACKFRDEGLPQRFSSRIPFVQWHASQF